MLSLEGRRGRAWYSAGCIFSAVVVAATDFLGDTNDLEAVSVEGDVGAERGTSGEEQFVVLLSEDDDLATLCDVISLEKAALNMGRCRSPGKLTSDSTTAPPALGELADLFDVAAIDERGRVTDAVPGRGWRFMSESGQLIGLHAGVLAGQGGNGAAEHRDEVGAELSDRPRRCPNGSLHRAHAEQSRGVVGMPAAIPNMVRKERSLLAPIERKTWAKMS